jgi:hypothetical protein
MSLLRRYLSIKWTTKAHDAVKLGEGVGPGDAVDIGEGPGED